MEKCTNKIKREFVSFSGKCPFNCLHCYTFHDDFVNPETSSVGDIIKSLDGKNFDIVYISGHRENFINVNDGILLAESIFEKYKCDILITTRNVFNDSQIMNLSLLNKKMINYGRSMYFCVSIPALESHKKIEPSKLIPSPIERIKFLNKIFNAGIYTFLTLRPLFPNDFIPITEPLNILDMCKEFTSVVISSQVIVEDNILKRLKTFNPNFKYKKDRIMNCFKPNYDVFYVDVEDEINQIRRKCQDYNIPFFEHSLPAIEYLKTNNKYST